MIDDYVNDNEKINKMSFREEQNGKFFMGNRADNLIVPESPFKNEFEKLQREKEEEEVRKLLFEAEKTKQEEINRKLQNLEMLPMGNRVIILPYPVNPYRKVVEGSIIVDYTGSFKNPDTGEMDNLKELVGCAQVIEVGQEVKYLKPGDDIYYDTRTIYPVPFMSLGYKITSEPSVLCVLNESLKERFKM